jgi:hypothetical protein
MEHRLPVAVVCRVLGAPRSTVYARRGRAGMPLRPGPATSISDDQLVRLIRRVLAASPFAGEGYRKVRARLAREQGQRQAGPAAAAAGGLVGATASPWAAQAAPP